MPITIGYAKANINPDLPVLLSGYDTIRSSSEIHDSLYARVLIFQDSQYYTIISLDTLAVDHHFTKLVREALTELGFKPEHIVVCATHTHSGPQGLCSGEHTVLEGLSKTFGEYDENYASFCVRQILEAVKEAQNGQQPFQVKLIKTKVSDVAQERHGRTGSMDGFLWAMEFIVDQGLPVLLYSYPCHPTILNAKNTAISADLCYGVEKSLGEKYSMTVFVNGAAGDISTRFVRREATFDEVVRLGKLVADTIDDSLLDAPLQTDSFLVNFQTWQYELRLKELPSEVQAQALLEHYQTEMEIHPSRLLESQLEGARANCQLAKHLAHQSNPIGEFMVLKLGPLQLVTMPLELYGSLAAGIEHKAMILGYANGYHLYLPDQAAYDKQDYEALSSPFESGQGEALMSWIETKLETMEEK